MIGTWRWFLALLVVNGHLFHPLWPAYFGVFSFFIISGFLMTLILNHHYSFSSIGFKAFWINRFLRLYPPYYIACMISILLILTIPSEFITEINSKLILRYSVADIITNITIFGLQPSLNQTSLVPPAWALSNEIAYYFVISYWAGKTKRNGFIFLCFSILYLIAIYFLTDFGWWYRYYHVGAGALPFAIGVNIYFFRKNLTNIIHIISWNKALLVSLTLYLSIFACGFFIGQTRTTIFYLNILSSSLLLSVLWNFPTKKFKKIDSLLGNLSYPTYSYSLAGRNFRCVQYYVHF